MGNNLPLWPHYAFSISISTFAPIASAQTTKTTKTTSPPQQEKPTETDIAADIADIAIFQFSFSNKGHGTRYSEQTHRHHHSTVALWKK